MKNIFLLVLCLGFITAPAGAAGINDIFKAVKNGDKSTVLAMLKKHPKLVLSRDSKGKTPLLVAVEQKNVAMADLLLRRGSRFTAKSAKGTPLHLASLARLASSICRLLFKQLFNSWAGVFSELFCKFGFPPCATK